MFKYALLIVLAAAPTAWGDSLFCQASANIRSELQQAAAHPVVNAEAFDQNVQPFLTLRQRHPENLFVQERYQDAVREFGIEGHLRALTADYQGRLSQHPEDLVSRYLYFRSLIGRSTPAALQGLTALASENPQFAPAHRMLAEIYGSKTFGDPEKQESERKAFMRLCPGSELAQLPDAIPDPSPLLGQAEELLSQNGNTGEVLRLALQSVRDDEWRLQRIRPVDWYSVEFKRQSQQNLQSEYWRLWALQVRCWRKSGQAEKATQLLATMEQRLALLPKSPRDPQYWEALAALTRLYAEGNQMQQAGEKLDQMQQYLAKFPDSGRTPQLEGLRKLVAGQPRSSNQ